MDLEHGAEVSSVKNNEKLAYLCSGLSIVDDLVQSHA